MANQYDTNLKLQAIADAIGDSSSSGLIQALEDIADAVAGGGGGGSSAAGLVSDNFSETDTYDLGDYCIHNNTLYVCINAITTPGTWDLSDWQATNSGLELSSLNSALDDLTGIASDGSENIGSYTSTEYVTPCDGYAMVDCSSSSSMGGKIEVRSSDGIIIAQILCFMGSYGINSIYVKKGMKLMCNTLGGSPKYTFRKLKH